MSNGKDGKRPAADDDAAWAGFLDDSTELDPPRNGQPKSAPPALVLHATEMQLMELADRTLPAAQRVQVLQHLDGCDRCRKAFAELVRDEKPPPPVEQEPEDPTKVARVSRKPAPAVRRDALIGSRLGEFEVHSRISQGGMGVVYRGLQPVIGKKVAIKILLPHIADDPEQVQRLLGEARAVNAIRHPNIVDIYSFGRLDDGRHYLVMELLDGEALSELVGRLRVVQPDQVLTVLDQALAALDAAHSAGVIHRDIKPSNIFVTTLPDGSWRVKLLDFGVAKVRGVTSATAPNIVLGTPGYMAPEQIRGEPVTPLTDLYAIGAVGYLLLTGNPPFLAKTIADLLDGHLHRAPAPPRSGAPAELEALVMQLLEKDPAKRPPSASAARRMVERIRKQNATNVGKPDLTPSKRRSAINLPPVVEEGERSASSTVSAPQPKPRPPVHDTESAPRGRPSPRDEDDPDTTTAPSPGEPFATNAHPVGPVPRRTVEKAPRGPIPTWAIIVGAAVLVLLALLLLFAGGSSDDKDKLPPEQTW